MALQLGFELSNAVALFTPPCYLRPRHSYGPKIPRIPTFFFSLLKTPNFSPVLGYFPQISPIFIFPYLSMGAQYTVFAWFGYFQFNGPHSLGSVFVIVLCTF